MYVIQYIKRDKMSDAQVIEQVLKGDTGAFEILILKYQSQIFYTALNIVFSFSNLTSNFAG